MTKRPVRRWIAAAIAVPALMVSAACGAEEATSSDSSSQVSESTTDSTTTDTTTDTSDTSAESTESGTYTAGTYDAEGSYSTPGGEQSIDVEVTIEADGTITDVEVTPHAESGNSAEFQEEFADGIADQVVGKRIDELDVSKVSGSSLTSGGFNAAIEDILAEAQA